MKISNKTLKKFFKGAINFHEENGYIKALKYSDNHLDLIGEYDSFWHSRAQTSSGVRIEFISEATAVSFKYFTPALFSNDNSVDLYINKRAYSVLHLEKAKGVIELNMPEGEKLISIYLPTDCEFFIKDFSFNAGYKSVKSKGERVLIVGDSITQGFGTMMSGASYANALQRKTGYDILAQGIGGLPFKKCALCRMGFIPDKIIVFLGTNYYECPDKYDYEKECTDFFTRLRYVWGEVPTIYISPLWRDNNVNWERFLWCIDVAKREALKQPNITVIDGFDLVPNTNDFFIDKVHPNAYGAELLASNLYNIMKDINF